MPPIRWNLWSAAATGMVRRYEADKDAMQRALGAGLITATDLADWLVRKANMPFRQAHGSPARSCGSRKRRAAALEDLSLAEMKKIDARITKDVFSVLTPEAAVKSRTSFGGTAPARVRQAVKEAKRRFR